MLIFVKGRYLDQIKAGTKTATFRPWKTTTLQRDDQLHFNGRVRVTITRVVRSTLSTVTDDDIRAIGFASRSAFRRAIRELYPTLPPDAPCVVLHFSPPPRQS